MKRRDVFKALLATVALTTGLARTSWALAEGEGYEQKVIALLEARIKAAQQMMKEQLERDFWSILDTETIRPDAKTIKDAWNKVGKSRYEYTKYETAISVPN